MTDLKARADKLLAAVDRNYRPAEECMDLCDPGDRALRNDAPALIRDLLAENARLSAELAEEYRLNAMGQEREAKLMAQVERLRIENARLTARLAKINPLIQAEIERAYRRGNHDRGEGHEPDADSLTALERIAAALEQDMRACELTDFWPPEAADAFNRAMPRGK